MSKPHDFIEEAQKGKPVDTGQVLTDAQLENGGLAPVKAWVRTRQSKNAARVKRHKEKQAAEGVKQLNLQAPESIHDTLKGIAKAVREGRDWRAETIPEETQRVLRVIEHGGWKARLIRWLTNR